VSQDRSQFEQVALGVSMQSAESLLLPLSSPSTTGPSLSSIPQDFRVFSIPSMMCPACSAHHQCTNKTRGTAHQWWRIEQTAKSLPKNMKETAQWLAATECYPAIKSERGTVLREVTSLEETPPSSQTQTRSPLSRLQPRRKRQAAATSARRGLG
jgi:hypothetical protein